MSKKAFTLIELLVVISIIGILSGIVVVQMNGAINATKDATKKADLNTIKKSLTIYKAQTGNSYPTESGCTIGSCANLDAALNGIMPTKMAGNYTYSSNGTSYTISSVLSSGYAYSYNSSTDSFTTAEPVAGVCGTANSKVYSSLITSYGSDTICAIGTENPTTVNFPDAGSSSSWTCVGLNSGTTASCSASRNSTPSCPTGATCSTVSADYVIQWKTVGSYTWTVPAGVSSVQYLVVAGGGGGGMNAGGGGGGGGFVEQTGKSVSPGTSITVTVGAGGAGSTSTSAKGSSGSNSVFDTVVAIGGGGGGSWNTQAGVNGGSGGGSSSTATVGSATQGNSGGGTGYGNNGGIGWVDYNGGGGGGAGAVGQASPAAGTGGAGGSGRQSSITGTSYYYGGGGGAGGHGSGTGISGAGGLGGGGGGSNGQYTPMSGGLGGTGGSTNGGNGVSGGAAGDGAPNTGGGGGGNAGSASPYYPGSGGSGVVIVKFAIQ